MPNTDPNNPNGSACVAQLPLMEWVPPGTAPQTVAVIPPIDLARYAYAHMELPNPTFTLNPAGNTEVNLATFITGLAGTGHYQATATLGAASETVTAVAGPGNTGWISISAPGGTGYSDCGINGTHDTPAQIAAAGAGIPPDCGVLFAQPSTGLVHVTVSITWQATWNGNVLGTPTLQNDAGIGNVAVRELQSVNG